MPVLENNGTLQDQKDCPHQDRTRVLPVLKGKVRQVHVVAQPHPCVPLPLLRIFFYVSGTDGTVSVSSAAANSIAGPGDKVSESRWEDRTNVLARLQLSQD